MNERSGGGVPSHYKCAGLTCNLIGLSYGSMVDTFDEFVSGVMIDEMWNDQPKLLKLKSYVVWYMFIVFNYQMVGTGCLILIV